MKTAIVLGLCLFLETCLPNALGQTNAWPTGRAFKHPGLLHTLADFQRIKAMLAQGNAPWQQGFETLKKHRQSQADGKMSGPFPHVVRDPKGSVRIAEMDLDANAAYQNALMWCLTGNEAHARKSVEILNAWSATLLDITGKDKELGASLGGFKFVNAAELMRHTYKGWAIADVRRCEKMLRNVFLPVVQNFATFANGNWDTGCLKTVMAIGVFCDDSTVFNRAVNYYYQGSGNGRLTHYVINPQGQCQESGRDQGHTQLGLGHLAEACETAWNQGLDLYGAEDNRLLKGFEYTARYNLGMEVPFAACTDTTGKYRHKKIALDGRGKLRPIYEMVWNHYENRRGIPAPFSKQAATKLRPEGDVRGADHPGFGTVMFYRGER